MSSPEQSSREVQLSGRAWKTIPEGAARWHEYNHTETDRSKREHILAQIVPVLIEIISSDLTPRQKQIMGLCFLDQKTQVQAAQTLGITQPTVNQHLSGKRRGGKKVGGAFHRIRKGIRTRALEREWSPEGDDIIAVLDKLLDQRITRRKAAALLASFVE